MACVVVTGGAGFIGSNLTRALLRDGHRVKVIDNLSTGKRENLTSITKDIELYQGDICDRGLLSSVFRGAECCFHEAALPSVSRSIEDPWSSNRVNVEGTLNVFLAAQDAGLRRVIYASSSAVYGDADYYPVSESAPTRPISPYGLTKAINEEYARVLSGFHDVDYVGLRYFNVFGPMQDSKSQYGAVIPIFISMMIKGLPPLINGDGQQSRDFTSIENVVSANLVAMKCESPLAGAYNIACGQSISLLTLVKELNGILGVNLAPQFGPPRSGDITRSCADITKARELLGYEPIVSFRDGLRQTACWFSEGKLR